MGYGTRGGSIRTFWPDDDENTMYLSGDTYNSLFEIIGKIKEKWGENVDLDKIQISSEYIHTDCLGYDRYDPSDYTNFIVINKM